MSTRGTHWANQRAAVEGCPCAAGGSRGRADIGGTEARHRSPMTDDDVEAAWDEVFDA